MQKKLRSVFAGRESRLFFVILLLLAGVFLISWSTSAFSNIVRGAILLVAAALTLFAVYGKAGVGQGDALGARESRSLLEAIKDAVIVYDEDFHITFFNKAAEELFGINTETALGHKLRPQDADEQSWRLLAQVVFTSLAPGIINRTEPGEYPQVADLSFGDSNLELRVTTSPVKSEEGKQVSFVKVVRDRTRELSLIKSKSEFLTIASHQLRTPVTEINWALETMGGDTGLGSESRKILDTALAAGRSLLTVVEDLLNVASIEEGKFGYEFKETDLISFLGGELGNIAPLARRAGIKIYFDKPDKELPKVFIDPTKLSIALRNLLENAIRYNTENGEVVVKVEKTESQPFVEVSVKDTGIGIPKDGVKNLFSKFFRAGNALKAQADGSGLGLYIVKNIIRAHGGEIWVESEENRGSIFHFTVRTDKGLIPKREVVIEE